MLFLGADLLAAACEQDKFLWEGQLKFGNNSASAWSPYCARHCARCCEQNDVQDIFHNLMATTPGSTQGVFSVTSPHFLGTMHLLTSK